jgi:hypothetical protein
MMQNNSEHDYLRDTLASTYRKCISCKIRTQFTCVKCGYCYSCHWKKEELEKVESEPLPTANSAFEEKYSQPRIIMEQSSSQQLQQHQTKVIDVYGKQIEPICNYRTCHHKFSVHGYGNHNCKCRHPLNYATGVSLWPLTKEERGSITYDYKDSTLLRSRIFVFER